VSYPGRVLATLQLLLAVALVGVGPPAEAGTRTGGINSDPVALTGASAPASPHNVWKIYDAAPELAADALLAAKAGPTRFIDGVTVTARGKPPMTGTVDLKPTLDRIKSGGSFPHRNDGSVFGNREGLLPAQPQGYYREYVHPTPGVSGPGPQRVITGQGGEMFYTPDHYQTFIPINP
jgi:guanyl-specific ribonuclease Sa